MPNQFDTIHCLFEQSGVFKNAFRDLGFAAYDYDIENTFNQTDFVVDLFQEIEKCYSEKKSIFDNFKSNSLVMAFFPCIYFEGQQGMYYSLDSFNLKGSLSDKIDVVIERITKREIYYKLLYKLVSICSKKRIGLIIENPATQPSYLLYQQNFFKPTFIDYNRRLSGDYFKKPTAYWFFGVECLHNQTYQSNKLKLSVKSLPSSGHPGKCSIPRSIMSSEYAHNFICDHLLGSNPKFPQQQTMF